jgi:peptide/nickel transport system substrate-binding protein
MTPGTPATGRELEILQPFAADLPPGTIEGYACRSRTASQTNRKNIRAGTRHCWKRQAGPWARMAS